MFEAAIEHIETDHITKYGLSRDGARLSFSAALKSWQDDNDFRTYFTHLLASSPFAAFRWETPPLTTETMDRGFEFVLINTPRFLSRTSDSRTFAEYFTDDTGHGVVTFASLGQDSTLVVPSPRTDYDAYGHLATFLRHAPARQIDSLWRVVGRTASDQIGHRPLWLNTAGGGVAWLHLRIDTRPKYYQHSAYRTY